MTQTSGSNRGERAFEVVLGVKASIVIDTRPCLGGSLSDVDGGVAEEVEAGHLGEDRELEK